MRRMVALAAAAVLAGAAAFVSIPASAASAVATPPASSSIQQVQYYGAGPHWGDDRWERRGQWREYRRERDEARIAEAARREAYRIEAEREQRRAWRRAQHGHGPAYGFDQYRSW